MITRVQSANFKVSFKDNSDKPKNELLTYKETFLKDQYEKQYQKDLQSFKKDNFLGLLFGLGFVGLDILNDNGKSAGWWLLACAVIYPVTFLFQPKKAKYDEELQEELNKLEADKPISN